MPYGWFSLKMANRLAADAAAGQRPPRGPEWPPVGLSAYATADGRHAVIVTAVSETAEGSQSAWEDTVPLGEVGEHLGTLPIGAVPEAPIAVPVALLYELLTDALPGGQAAEGRRCAAAMAAEALRPA
jgi:hypothetical protein